MTGGGSVPPVRRAGYRLLGPSFDYLLHMRPAEWPIMAVHLLTGSALAIGLAGILEGAGGWALWAGAAGFVGFVVRRLVEARSSRDIDLGHVSESWLAEERGDRTTRFD